MKVGKVTPFIVFKSQRHPFEIPSPWRLITMTADEKEVRTKKINGGYSKIEEKKIS